MAHAQVHVRGTAPQPYKPGQTHEQAKEEIKSKTKFYSVNDQVDALWLLIRTPAGRSAASSVEPRKRVVVRAEVNALFNLEAWLQMDASGRRVKFAKEDQRKAGLQRTLCVLILEGRERNGQLYPHIQSFYPDLRKVMDKVLAVILSID